MTKKVALFVDNGGEELELIAPLDNYAPCEFRS